MGGVGHEAALGVDQFAETSGHVVELAGQGPHLRGADVGVGPGGQVALTQAGDRRLESGERA